MRVTTSNTKPEVVLSHHKPHHCMGDSSKPDNCTGDSSKPNNCMSGSNKPNNCRSDYSKHYRHISTKHRPILMKLGTQLHIWNSMIAM